MLEILNSSKYNISGANCSTWNLHSSSLSYGEISSQNSQNTKLLQQLEMENSLYATDD